MLSSDKINEYIGKLPKDKKERIKESMKRIANLKSTSVLDLSDNESLDIEVISEEEIEKSLKFVQEVAKHHDLLEDLNGEKALSIALNTSSEDIQKALDLASNILDNDKFNQDKKSEKKEEISEDDFDIDVAIKVAKETTEEDIQAICNSMAFPPKEEIKKEEEKKSKKNEYFNL